MRSIIIYKKTSDLGSKSISGNGFMFSSYSRLKIVISIVFVLTQTYSMAQYQAPYKIKNRGQTELYDSVWVLFPDIQSSKNKIIVPANPIKSPTLLNIGDSILLDSNYMLDIIIIDIEWSDLENCVVSCRLPRRQNAVLKIKYRTFGMKWVFEGITGYDPISCDHLTLGMWDENNISFGISFSSNCK